MTRREIVHTALRHERPEYVPWHFNFTVEAQQLLQQHYGPGDLDEQIGNHILWLGSPVGVFSDVGNNHVRDHFGVIWDRSIDKDIGIVSHAPITEPTLNAYRFPDPLAGVFFDSIPAQIAASPDRFRVFAVGFSLYERAWTLRGMENLMVDFLENPAFAHQLFDTICDYNIAHLRRALQFDIDAVEFGDDWGQQVGLQMGKACWMEFIQPRLKRMCAAVKSAGKFVMIHSCGDVDELFDELIAIGVDCFNPFQPEVMDVKKLMVDYRGRLSFFGGLSTQKTLPFATPDQVRAQSRSLLSAGRLGGYIFSPAHAVEGDVPLENLLAAIDEARANGNV